MSGTALVLGYFLVAILGAACVIWWYIKRRETFWWYTIYVAIILIALGIVMFI